MDSQLSKSDIAAVVGLVLAVTQRPPGLKSRSRRLLQKLSEALDGAQGCLFLLPRSPADAAPDAPLIHITDPSEHGRHRAAMAMRMIRSRILTQSPPTPIEPQALTGPAASLTASVAAQATTWRQPIENGHAHPPGPPDPEDGNPPPDGELLCSIRPLSPARLTCLALHRPAPAAGFTDRELAFVELVHDTCPLLGGPSVEPEDAPHIPRRRREVLDFLCDGHSEKEISNNMGVALSTVRTHVKDLYKQFAVANRAELLSIWVRKSGAHRKVLSR